MMSHMEWKLGFHWSISQDRLNLMFDNSQVSSQWGKNRTRSVFVFAMEVINSLFFLQVHNRKQFSTCA